MKMIIGGRYNWKGQPERLVYLGDNLSGNGFWHQFAKVDSPAVVWCEVKGYQLEQFEETACGCAPGTCESKPHGRGSEARQWRAVRGRTFEVTRT